MFNTCALPATSPARRLARRRPRTLSGADRLLLLVLGSSLVLTAAVLFIAKRSAVSAGTARAGMVDNLERACRERAELTQALLRTEGP